MQRAAPQPSQGAGKKGRKPLHGTHQDPCPALPVSGPVDLDWPSWSTEPNLCIEGWAPTAVPPQGPSKGIVGDTLNYTHESFSNSSVQPDSGEWCLPKAGSLAWVCQALGPQSGRKTSRGPGQASWPLLSLPCLLWPHLPHQCAEFTHCRLAVLGCLIWR